MLDVESNVAVNGNPYREIEACITKAEEEINLTLRALSCNNVRVSSKSAESKNDIVDSELAFRSDSYRPRPANRRSIRAVSDQLQSPPRDRCHHQDQREEEGGGEDDTSGISPCSTSERQTSLEKKIGALRSASEQKKRQQLSKNAHRDYWAWKNFGGTRPPPRLIHSMHALNASSPLVNRRDDDKDDEDKSTATTTQYSSSSASSSACSTLSSEQLLEKRRSTTTTSAVGSAIHKNMFGGRNSESAYFVAANPLESPSLSSSSLSATNRFQSARNLLNEARREEPPKSANSTTTSSSGAFLYSSTSAYELLDLTNSDSVIRWTSQILAELDSIADCPPEIVVDDDEKIESRRKRDSFVVPLEAKRKLEEACSELRELKVCRASGGPLSRAAAEAGNRKQENVLAKNGTVKKDEDDDSEADDCATPTVSVSHTWPLEQSKTTYQPQEQRQQVHQKRDSIGSQASSTSASDLASKSKRTTAATDVSLENRLYCSTKNDDDDVDLQSSPSGDSIRARTNICPFPTATRGDRRTTTATAEMNNDTEAMIQAVTAATGSRTKRHRGGGGGGGGAGVLEGGQQLPGANDNHQQQQLQRTMTNYVSERRQPTRTGLDLNNLSAYEEKLELGDQHRDYKNRRNSAQNRDSIAYSSSNGRQYRSYRSSTSPIQGGKSVRGVVESLIRQAETHLGTVGSSTTATTGYANPITNANNNCINDFGGGGDVVNWRRRDSEWNRSPFESMEKGSTMTTTTTTGSWLRSSRSNDYVELHDACTQTTPVSLSRSSSFTWVSEIGNGGGQNRHSYEVEEEASPTDTSGGSGLDDEDLRSLTPMTDRPDSNANMLTGLVVDHGSALDKSLSLSGISRSSSSSADLNEYVRTGEPHAVQKLENRGTVMGVSAVNSAIQRRSSGRGNEAKAVQQKGDSCETWPPPAANNASTTLTSGDPLLTESLRLLLETVNGSSTTTTTTKAAHEGPSGNQGSTANPRQEAASKFDNAPVSVRSLGAGRDLTRLLIASSAQQQQNQRAVAFPYTEAGGGQQQRRIGSSIPSQQHVHVSYDARKCLGSLRSPSENESDFEESIYDNVPRTITLGSGGAAAAAAGRRATGNGRGGGASANYGLSTSNKCGKRGTADVLVGSPLLRRACRPLAATPDSPIEYSQIPTTAILLGDKSSSNANMQRDVSVASGLLADSESSPIFADRGFALLDGFRSDMATPDSIKSLTSSDGGGNVTACSSQPAPEFQYKSARDYMMDRETQILAMPCSRSSHHRCPATTTETTAAIGFVVPKESVLRGETTRFLSPPSPNTVATNSTTTAGGESSSTLESGGGSSKLSLLVPFETRSALANSLPALDRLLDSHLSAANLSPGPARAAAAAAMMTASSMGAAASGDIANYNGTNSVDLVADSETAESSGAVFSSRKENAEAEARQCCFWLKAAGFPQYASMYEDGQFPIDIEAVQKDHEFLDSDSLQALFRRLRALNQCALMKLGAGPYQKRIMQSATKPEKDSDDEEDEIALSRKWRFVRKSRTWSRIVNEFGSANGQYQLTPTDGSLSPPQTVGSTIPGPSHPMDENDSESVENSISISGRQQSRTALQEPTSPSTFVKLRNASLRHREPDSKVDDSQTKQQQQQQRLRRSQSERLRDRAKALVRRMELMKNGRLRRRSPSLRRNNGGGAEPEISGPVLIQHFSASPAHMRMLKDTSVSLTTASGPPTASQTSASTRPISSSHTNAQPLQQQQQQQQPAVMAKTKFVANDERRRGRIFSGELSATGEQSTGDSRTMAMDYRSTENVLDGDSRIRSGNAQLLSASGHRQSYQQVQQSLYDRNGKRQHPESDSSPETQAKSGSSSLRVQVDVELRANTLPPVSQSSFDSSDADHSPQCWERRDSGVGSSLSRSPSAPARPRVRWHSFQRRHGPSAAAIRSGDAPASVDHLTAPQVIAVQKYALLKLTALMEKYSPSYKSSGWSWGVQKLLRRMKASETKVDKDRQVFGVPFSVIAQRTGQPLPQCILHALRYLRKQAVDNVGLFRKSGVRSRIQKLRQLCETSTDLPVFESQQAYDVADMVKQYFRELPEPLLTSKLSETFIAIHLNVPEHLRMEAMQKLVLLLPDENREVLLSLLYFLHDVAAHSDRNQMTAQNLAVCFAPTLFQMSGRNAAISPTRRHKTITAASGVPNEKELMENRAAQMCLASMIIHCKKLFSVPQDILMKCAHTVAELHEPSNLAELGYPYGNYSTYLTGCVDALMKEHRERWRGWVTEGCIDGVEITSKKANDEYPLKLWRCWVDVEAPPRELLHRILRERDAWDDDIIKWRVVRKLSENCEVFQFVVNDMPPHPTRDYCVVRQWQSDIHELRGGCVLVQTSVNVQEAPMLGGVRGVCLASRYLIEPSGGGKSRITHVDRVDMRGRSKAWYNKIFGYLIAMQLARLRDSFKQMAEGPETKV